MDSLIFAIHCSNKSSISREFVMRNLCLFATIAGELMILGHNRHVKLQDSTHRLWLPMRTLTPRWSRNVRSIYLFLKWLSMGPRLAGLLACLLARSFARNANLCEQTSLIEWRPGSCSDAATMLDQIDSTIRYTYLPLLQFFLLGSVLF